MKKAAPEKRGVIYDRLASHYDEAMRPMERWLLARLRSRALSLLPDEGRILEIGAGTGLNFPYYPNHARVVASEISREMLKRASSKRERAASVSLLQASAEMLPFPDDAFDAALSTLVLCSVASIQKSLAELRRVVRRDGKIILLEHVRPANVLGPVFDLLSVLTVALFDDHFNRRTAEEARRAGLRIVHLEKRALGIINIIVLETA
jgi:ubiquinone/menaquinone biosynthesis C-methylase UbiE